MNISEYTAVELSSRIRSHDVGVREVVEATLTNIAANDHNYHAFLSVFREQALRRADEVQQKLDAGALSGPLVGVPVGIKDNICIKDLPTTCGSRMLEGFCPPYDATVINKLLDAGAVMIGKLNMDEFAMGSTTETSYYGACKNPWDVSRVPGGSSGGAAAAVAAGEVPFTLGSDTGGSIRQPCSFCGVTGIKPTYGAVSRYGLVAYASSLDQIGPIARDARDLAAVLDCISGKDPRDATSAETSVTGCAHALTGDIRGLKIGIPSDCFGEGLDPDVKKQVLKCAEKLEELGAVVEEFPMPVLEYAISAYYIIAWAEVSSNLSRYDGIKYGLRVEDKNDLYELYLQSRSQGFGMEAKRRIMLGNFVLSSGYYDAYYNKALRVRAIIKRAFDDAFGKYDLLLTPTAPTTAPRLGESLCDPLKMYLGDIYTVPVNLAGLPGLTAPCGFDRKGLPIGVQLIGRPFGEKTLLNTAFAYQQATDFHKMRPMKREEAAE